VTLLVALDSARPSCRTEPFPRRRHPAGLYRVKRLEATENVSAAATGEVGVDGVVRQPREPRVGFTLRGNPVGSSPQRWLYVPWYSTSTG